MIMNALAPPIWHDIMLRFVRCVRGGCGSAGQRGGIMVRAGSSWGGGVRVGTMWHRIRAFVGNRPERERPRMEILTFSAFSLGHEKRNGRRKMTCGVHWPAFVGERTSVLWRLAGKGIMGRGIAASLGRWGGLRGPVGGQASLAPPCVGRRKEVRFFLLCFICFKEFARYFKRGFGEGI
jgi:hypothetical protein